MLSKVSMIIPCYNKSEYIKEMFDSILMQDWDNIELILVNDGSTDGTYEIIIEYESKFLIRGYEVIIINQENAGVCAAAKVGLEQISGNYVCMIDADDVLDPQYVSVMADWMETHADCDLVCSGYAYFTEDNGSKTFFKEWLPPKVDFNIEPEDFFQSITPATIWSYMLRREYFEKTCITQTYFVDTRGSHEPGFMIPMTAYGGKAHGIERALYQYRRGILGAHSQHDTFFKFKEHFDEYYFLCKQVIFSLPSEVADDNRKRKLIFEAEFRKFRYLIANQGLSDCSPNDKLRTAVDLIEWAIKMAILPENLGVEDIIGQERLFLKQVRDLAEMKLL